jgi:hypothetical protein
MDAAKRLDVADVKLCTRCGTAYTRETWKALPFVGMQSDGEGGAIELRNCTCYAPGLGHPTLVKPEEWT